MSDWRLHTPQGVLDILPAECSRKKQIESAIWSVFTSMGYKEVETPSFEFYDCYIGGGGQITQETMYKFFDENGRILALRPDITTSIARMAATKEKDSPLPLRYCYTGNVFRQEQTEGARQREFTQAGIELIGSTSPVSDAEVIAAAIEAVIALEIEDFHMEIGQVAFFNGLCAQIGLDADEIEKLRERIDSKDSVGIKTLVDKYDTDSNIKELIISLPYLFGTSEIFEKANISGLNKTSKDALLNLKTIYELLVRYGFEKYVSIDLGMLQSIDYYTGSIFKCYTHGVSFPIVAGGRYDNLVGKFGRDAGAVGAAFGINRIMSALRSAKKADSAEDVSSSLLYTEEDAEEIGYDLALSLRLSGCIVEQYLGDGTHLDAESFAKERNIGSMLRVFSDGTLQIKDFATNEITETTVCDFIDYYEEDSHEHHHDHDCDCGCHH